MRKQKKTNRKTLRGGYPQRCRMNRNNCPFADEVANIEEGELGYNIEHQLAKQIVYHWCFTYGGCVEISRNGNEYYLHCDGMRDSEHHIHIFPFDDSYIYKRNGNHNRGGEEQRGYGLTEDSDYCLEYGANYDWEYTDWIQFLHRRLCDDDNYGICADEVNNNNNNNNNNMNING
jgi:hypothetical protein